MVDSKATVAALKVKIQEQRHVPPYQQRLIFAGKIVADGHPLSDLDIKKDRLLTLQVCIQGGGPYMYVKSPGSAIRKSPRTKRTVIPSQKAKEAKENLPSRLYNSNIPEVTPPPTSTFTAYRRGSVITVALSTPTPPGRRSVI